MHKKYYANFTSKLNALKKKILNNNKKTINCQVKKIHSEFLEN